MLERLPFLSVLLTAVPTSQPLSTVLGSSGCSEPSCALWGGLKVTTRCWDSEACIPDRHWVCSRPPCPAPLPGCQPLPHPSQAGNH